MTVLPSWKFSRLLLWAVGSWCVMAFAALVVGIARGDDPASAVPVLTAVLLAEGALLGALVLRLLRLRRVLGSERRVLEEFKRRSPESGPVVGELEKLNEQASQLATV